LSSWNQFSIPKYTLIENLVPKIYFQNFFLRNILKIKIICISLFSKVNPMKELVPSVVLFIVGISGMSLVWSNGLSDLVNERQQGPVISTESSVIRTKAIPVHNPDSGFLYLRTELEIKSDTLSIARK